MITASWLDVTNRVTDDRFSQLYDMEGLIPIASTVMAVAIGVLAGALLRRTVTAMAATIGTFIGVRLLLAIFLRPRLMAPEVLDASLGADSMEGVGAWILSEKTFDGTGTMIGTEGGFRVDGGLLAKCPDLQGAGGTMPAPADVNACLSDLGYHTVTRFHPADRFWTFQILESLIMLGIATTALGMAFWLVRRKIS